MANYDFSGWATRNDLQCSDGRTIRRDAFKGNDGTTVPLVWNHEHNDPNAVLGHAMLENRDDGVYAYGTFNDTEQGQHAKKLLQNGDVRSLSIWANQLKQIGGDVMHGNIRELSLVLSGANPGAYVDFVMAHSDDEEDTLYASYDENLMIWHSDQPPVDNKKGDDNMADTNTKPENKAEEQKSVEDIINSMNEDQRGVMDYMVGLALEEGKKDDGGDDNMKHNVFEGSNQEPTQVLSHSDEQAIVALAKQSNVGSLKQAIQIYAEEHDDTLSHGVFDDNVEKLFPEYELLKKGEPETLERDQSWIAAVISKIHKSPISRIRTRQADARIAELRAKGYQKKGNYKENMAQIKLLGRTTDPQTIYIKDEMHRDDIIDITDFDIVAYQWRMMRHLLDEELAMAALVGDQREEGDPDKIHEDHIRSIWHDDELYTIHYDVDIAAAKTALQGSNTALQGSNTSANFGENYIYAEAIITASLYSREKYKGSGTPDLYCTPHLLNVMLLARDLNGRRIYDSKADLAAALNVGDIHTVEQFEGLTRTDASSKKHKLLGIFVNLADYQFGSTKGGEITKFDDFDMDFNRYKYMLETRLSGSLTRVYSAIALEEPTE
nr:MAG TPA: major capsid protein [Caudoviricetes sp.]